MSRWVRLGAFLLAMVTLVLGGEMAGLADDPADENQTDDHYGDHYGDHYFDAIAPTAQGYLVWTEQPVQIYVQPASQESGSTPVPGSSSGPAASQTQPNLAQQRWQFAVEGAIADWSEQLTHHAEDLPIRFVRTRDRDRAHIRILRQAPPLKWSVDGPRARNAETRFRIVWSQSGAAERCFRHQQTIFLSDRQGTDLLRGTARHELGHALGLWGHSPDPGDALYATQVGSPAPISARDLNTLKLVYQQPRGLRCLDSTPGAGYGPEKRTVSSDHRQHGDTLDTGANPATARPRRVR